MLPVAYIVLLSCRKTVSSLSDIVLENLFSCCFLTRNLSIKRLKLLGKAQDTIIY
uniref:Uncharacterized protein n=1 Tax=Rhizophora mucronata TaxID=61149 RepID=A0A2P2R214_RHIMU